MENMIEIWDYDVEGVYWRIGVNQGRVCLALPIVAEEALRKVSARLVSRLDASLVKRRSSVADSAADEIRLFLKGGLKTFDFDVMLAGSEFQQRVWREMMRINYGERVTYGELARRCGCPASVRAVAGACGANAVLLAVPCHRVVAASGPGGFSAGMELKIRLMEIES